MAIINRVRCASAVLALAIAAVPRAQVAQTGAAPDRVPQVADIGRTVTLRGCLKSWDGSPTGIGRSAVDATGAPQYVLTDVEDAAEVAPPLPIGTSGTGAPAPPRPAMAHDTYVVRAENARVTLNQHLDQQVEVTGMLEVVPPHDASGRPAKPIDPPPTGTVTPSVTPAPELPAPRTEADVPQAPLQRVTVTALKPIARTCQ